MDGKLVKLRFLGPVHFGQGRLTDGACTCDAATLFSALFIEALQLGQQDALLEAAQMGELALSDGFPFRADTLYLPKPLVELAMPRTAPEQSPDSREKKANKKLDYISAASYGAYLGGSFDALHEYERLAQGGGFGSAYVQTKVNLTHADDPNANPYQVGGFRFAPNAGIYFLVRGGYNIESLLDQLQYSGLGGKRTSGYGRFSYVVESASPFSNQLAISPAGGRHMLLSSAAPREEELTEGLLSGARYKLLRKGGFVQSTSHAITAQKKRDLYVFGPGSVFSRTFEGAVFDVNSAPGAHPVYRYARAMWLEV